MKSKIFFSQTYKQLEKDIKVILNKYPDFLSQDTAISTRATGDAIQHILEENFEKILGSLNKTYSKAFARRAMADIAFTDQDDLYYVIDVKTHRLETKFNMPNLTSVERLARFYEDDKNYFAVLMVAYNIVKEIRLQVSRVHFVPIEFLSWECLTLGALGWGQIQIANTNNIIITPTYSRKKWMLQLCDILFDFYPREIGKIKGRIDYFRKVKNFWESKKDIWE